LITDGAGNYYGTTSGNYGGIFKYSASSGIQLLASFNITNGQEPVAGLIEVGGTIYGTAAAGGTGSNGFGTTGVGTFFQYTTQFGIQALGSFSNTTGYSPQSGLITDGSGDFFGTTRLGGASSDGTIYKYSAGGGIQALGTFTGANGAMPNGGLVSDGAGNYYGAASSGGANNAGGIYKYSAGSGIQLLASFTGANGSAPESSLVADGAGTTSARRRSAAQTAPAGSISTPAPAASSCSPPSTARTDRIRKPI